MIIIKEQRKMKTKLFLLLTILLFGMNFKTLSQDVKMNSSTDSLCILWTSADPDVALKMVFMYATNSKLKQWWGDVELIVWGPSAKLAADNPEIQSEIKKMIEKGVRFEVCKACSDQYGVSDKLSSLGISVKYMGQPFTKILKSGKKLITF